MQVDYGFVLDEKKKILKLLADYLYCPKMGRDIERHIHKPKSKQNTHGLYTPLHIPSVP